MTTNPNILIYQNANGNIKVDVKFEDETLWLTQKQIVWLFEKKDLDEKVVCRKAQYKCNCLELREIGFQK